MIFGVLKRAKSSRPLRQWPGVVVSSFLLACESTCAQCARQNCPAPRKSGVLPCLGLGGCGC